MKLTPWFYGGVKPLADRPGIYETDFRWPGFSYWSGSEWGNQSNTLELAVEFWEESGTDGASQEKTWRGLSEKPK